MATSPPPAYRVQAIETALRDANITDDVAVVPCARRNGKSLVAFYVPRHTAQGGGEAGEEGVGLRETAEAKALRACAEALLLPHSRPELFFAVTTLPLTSSGKTHRHALAQMLQPEPSELSEHAGQVRAAPRLNSHNPGPSTADTRARGRGRACAHQARPTPCNGHLGVRHARPSLAR